MRILIDSVLPSAGVKNFVYYWMSYVQQTSIDDLTFWLVPEVDEPGNVAVTREHPEAVLRGADGLIAISENTRNDAIRVLGVPPEKIEVIYPGVWDGCFKVSERDRLGMRPAPGGEFCGGSPRAGPVRGHRPPDSLTIS